MGHTFCKLFCHPLVFTFMKQFSWFSVLVIALASSLGALYLDHQFFRDKGMPYVSIAERQKEVLGKYAKDSVPAFSASINFVAAAQKVQDAVVHIRSTYSQTPSSLRKMHPNVPGFDDFFESPGGANQSSGSGVILTDDGLIVTNHHVVDEASTIEVILNNKQSFPATLLGTDPTTDLALLRIEAKGLPFIPYGDSDGLTIGEWVLAIGNPFDLTSTVTAGIISGKGRSINLLREKSNLAIESFIQTDAAVNPGNSGGALVNLKGDLVGINTAIASSTGSYSGYSFAVPVNLVKKVIQDLKEFGVVQRGLLGVSVQDVDARMAADLQLKAIEGVFVREVNQGSAASTAGIRKGDLILSINGKKVNSVPELQEAVGRYRPGEKIKASVLREGQISDLSVVLKNQVGTTQMMKEASGSLEVPELGATLGELPSSKKKELGIEFGLDLTQLQKGPLQASGLEEGYVLYRMDRKPLRQPQDAQNLYRQARGGILVEAFSPDGRLEYFAVVKK